MQIVCPGDQLAVGDAATAGRGCYVRKGKIYAAILGVKETTDGIVSVKSHAVSIDTPKIGDRVFGKITKLSARFANVEFLLESKIDKKESFFNGVIRKENVRKTEIDRVKLWQCFSVGDLVRCRVLTLGNAKHFELSTDEIDLGVVYAECAESGKEMVALSWEEMQCPESMIIEKRKVAKMSE